MLFCDFYSKLQRINPALFVDPNNQVTWHVPEFPLAGLYYGDKFLIGINRQNVPEYSILAVNTPKLRSLGYTPSDFDGSTGQWYDQDYIDQIPEQDLDFKLLAKGYRAILADLVRKGYLDQRKTEQTFHFKIEINRYNFPRRYIDLGF